MTFSTHTFVVFATLLLLQCLAALPWALLAYANRPTLMEALQQISAWLRDSRNAGRLGMQVLGVLVGVLVAAAVATTSFQDRNSLEALGYVYGAVLQLQLLIDAFILVFALLLQVWPKGGAIALASFLEGVRQPMFWLIFLAALVFLSISPLIPYFTFGDDHLLVKDLGYDTLMLAGVVFGALAASLSISEEIEGRTAVTLMSKPVSRRQFLLGKFVGIVLAAGVYFALLGAYFEGTLLFKHWWDRADPTPTPVWVTATLEDWSLSAQATDLLRGLGCWTDLSLDTAPGLVLGFAKVMVLVSIAVSLAVRVPMVVNLVAVLVIYLLANLTPELVSLGYQAQAKDPGSAVSQLLAFMAQLLDTLLPDLDAFRLDSALLADAPLSRISLWKYLGSVSLYGILYTGIALLFGLILFEDRDLA
jgi:hypothetical protein